MQQSLAQTVSIQVCIDPADPGLPALHEPGILQVPCGGDALICASGNDGISTHRENRAFAKIQPVPMAHEIDPDVIEISGDFFRIPDRVAKSCRQLEIFRQLFTSFRFCIVLEMCWNPVSVRIECSNSFTFLL